MGVALIVTVSRDYKKETTENTRMKNTAEQILRSFLDACLGGRRHFPLLNGQKLIAFS